MASLRSLTSFLHMNLEEQQTSLLIVVVSTQIMTKLHFATTQQILGIISDTNHVRHCPKLSNFKTKLKTYLFTVAFNRTFVSTLVLLQLSFNLVLFIYISHCTVTFITLLIKFNSILSNFYILFHFTCFKAHEYIYGAH